MTKTEKKVKKLQKKVSAKVGELKKKASKAQAKAKTVVNKKAAAAKKTVKKTAATASKKVEKAVSTAKREAKALNLKEHASELAQSVSDVAKATVKDLSKGAMEVERVAEAGITDALRKSQKTFDQTRTTLEKHAKELKHAIIDKVEELDGEYHLSDKAKMANEELQGVIKKVKSKFT